MYRLCACVLVAALLAAPSPLAGEGRVFELPTALTTAEDVNRAIESALASGSDTLQAHLPGLALVAGRETFDPIDDAIRKARERRLRVHGVVTIGAVTAGGELPASRDHVVYQHPEWLMIPRALSVELRAIDPRHPGYLGRLLRWTRAHTDGVLYVSAVYPESASYLAAALSRSLKRYAVDEVTLDLRLPGTDFDYSARAMELFRAAHRPTLPMAERRRMDEIEPIDPFAWADEFPAEWSRFQRGRWDALMASLRGIAAVERPATVVHARVPAGTP